MALTQFTVIDDGHYRLALSRLGLQFDVTRLRWDRGELHGLLSVSCDLPDTTTIGGVLSVGTFNLTSVSVRTTRAKDLRARAGGSELDFGLMLEELCQRTIQAEQAGGKIDPLRRARPPPRLRACHCDLRLPDLTEASINPLR